MAYNKKQAEALQAPAVVTMALILFTATTEAQILPPIGLVPPPGGLLNLTSLNITGRVCCTGTGNCPLTSSGTAGVAGAEVDLNCTNLAGASIQVGQGTTNVNGTFDISVTNLQQILGNTLSLNRLIPCTIRVPLPLRQAACPTLNTARGVLNGVPSILTGLTEVPSGLLGSFFVPQFTLKATAGV